MELIARARCQNCLDTAELPAGSLEGGRIALRSEGWRIGRDDATDQCPRCVTAATPTPAPTPRQYPCDPSSHAYGAVVIAPILKAGGFAHEPGADIWRDGPDFCWEEAVPQEEFPQGAELCVRVHYALGTASRNGRTTLDPYTAEDDKKLTEALDRLARYLTEQGFRSAIDARDGERRHLVVHRLPGEQHPSRPGVRWVHRPAAP
ncbi:hypothetical protein [Streptomyces sp. SUK 48]|uniref:hypothetical protein n=1 Tax=Streptomyces sp. SUK 48 TaxID=2582831 RepID=UPI00129A954D|nr:hypothetical protein [Streptomyces sp. SUK 48]